MILSFHPLFEADHNILCAGRLPDITDLEAIKAAAAVILPQGCSQALYEMAEMNCSYVFPNYDTRFKYPGKTGQIHLFQKLNVAHPQSAVYPNVAAFSRKHGDAPSRLPHKLPFVFKFDWGDEGDTVYLIDSPAALQETLRTAVTYESSGQNGFLIQEYIPEQNKTLRVVIIGQKVISYWRVQQNMDCFHVNLSKGANIDTDGDPDLQQLGVTTVKDVCKQTAIDLAGFDVIFSNGLKPNPEALLLEINYFFGRKGLGGSARYYEILMTEITKWLNSLNI